VDEPPSGPAVHLGDLADRLVRVSDPPGLDHRRGEPADHAEEGGDRTDAQNVLVGHLVDATPRRTRPHR
jgi:hypothetical protein